MWQEKIPHDPKTIGPSFTTYSCTYRMMIKSSEVREMDNFYLFLASDDSLLTHVNNTADDFVVELPRRYRLDGTWECAISEITFVSEFEQLTDRIDVCADVIDDSYVRGTTLPVLRSIDVDTDLSFNPLCYIKVQTDELRRIRIFIRDRNLKTSRFKFDRLYCTLHFRQRGVR